MYIELRERKGKHYVMLRHEDSKEKPVAQFVSTNQVEAYNVAKQYAKQNSYYSFLHLHRICPDDCQ